MPTYVEITSQVPPGFLTGATIEEIEANPIEDLTGVYIKVAEDDDTITVAQAETTSGLLLGQIILPKAGVTVQEVSLVPVEG